MKITRHQIISVILLTISFCGSVYGGGCYCVEMKQGEFLYDCKKIKNKFFCSDDKEKPRRLIKKNMIEDTYTDGNGPCSNCQMLNTSRPRVFRGDDDEEMQNQ